MAGSLHLPHKSQYKKICGGLCDPSHFSFSDRSELFLSDNFIGDLPFFHL